MLAGAKDCISGLSLSMNQGNEMSAFPVTGASPTLAGSKRARLRVPITLLLATLVMGSGCALPRIHLPEAKPTIPPLNQNSLVFDANGHLITVLHAGENRALIPIEEIPFVTRQAVVAAEDERFYQHHGVDAKAIIRATLANTEKGRVVQGGSTITEQLVKNTIGTGERTLLRKIREAETAWALENNYSKNEILAMYLNTVYFGQGAYGIQAAAKTYFSIPAWKLSLTQSALLAGLIRSPSTYDPLFNAGLAKQRRDYVLSRMNTLGMITPSQYHAARAEQLQLDPYVDNGRYPAPYFVDYVKRWFLSNEAFGATYQDRYHLLFEGGLHIYTTVDLTLQRQAEQAVNSILSYSTDPFGAMTVIDPHTGAIKAMVGGRDYFSKKGRFAKLNLATGGATGRQAGSSFKPFALVAALNSGIPPTQLYQAPSHIDIRLPHGYVPNIWPVDNYDGQGGGVMTLEDATINSVNTVYAQVIMQVGPKAVVDVAHQMGITRHLSAVPSAVLGTNEVDTLQMASAFGTLATMGKHTEAMAVTKVTDAAGGLVYQADPQPEQVINAGVAWTVDQILQKVVQYGTGSQANIGRPAAGKTGTAQQWSDAWFVGFTPDLVAAVWVGFPQGRIRMVAPRTRLDKVLGGRWPAEIWHAFMVNATRGTPVKGFPRPKFGYAVVPVDVTRGCLPNTWTLPQDIKVIQFFDGTQPMWRCNEPSGPQLIPVPSVVGMSEEAAVALLKSYAFLVAVSVDDVPGVQGLVVSQDPARGAAAMQRTVVTIHVASGAPLPSPSPNPTPTESTPPPTPTPTPSPSPSPSP
jgi:penicillin-binding protein 1A